MPAQPPRRLLLGGLGAGAVLAAAGCSEPGPPRGTGTPADSSGRPQDPARHELVARSDGRVTLLPAMTASNAVVEGLFERSTAVVLIDPAAPQGTPAHSAAAALGVPLVLTDATLQATLTALGTRTAISYAGSLPSLQGIEVIEGGSATPTVPGLPLGGVGAGAGAAILLHSTVSPAPAPSPSTTPSPSASASSTPSATAPDPVFAHNVALSRAVNVQLKRTDPRAERTAYEEIRRALTAPVIAVGAALGPLDRLTQRIRTVRHASEVPGGGFLPLTGRMMIALYGHPESAALGMLGEQPAGEAVARTMRLTAEYAALISRPVLPAFELIATVASASAGKDGDYSRETALDVLTPWVDTAIEGGCYVVLDLQPGRTDFLTQAKAYEPLLLRPEVGLALDPEWRLGPNEKHLVQIGHVGIEEVNAVGEWLAALVREHDLPPKVLTLHQFQLQMIRGRERLRTDLDELQFLVHVDGSGGQGAKRATWGVIREGLPKEIFLGWKNFKDEDFPMLTPAQTMAQVKPTPSFVSYQ